MLITMNCKENKRTHHNVVKIVLHKAHQENLLATFCIELSVRYRCSKKKKETLLQAQQVQSNSDILMSPYKFHLK